MNFNPRKTLAAESLRRPAIASRALSLLPSSSVFGRRAFAKAGAAFSIARAIVSPFLPLYLSAFSARDQPVR